MTNDRLQARAAQVQSLRGLEQLLTQQIDAAVSNGENPKVLKRKRAEVRTLLEDSEGALSYELRHAQLVEALP